MKKFFTGIGVLALVLTVLFSISMVLLKIDKARYDDIAEGIVRQIVNGLSDLSTEQFDAYWGPAKPGTPEQRKAMINKISKLGVLKQIDKVEMYKYVSKFTFNSLAFEF